MPDPPQLSELIRRLLRPSPPVGGGGVGDAVISDITATEGGYGNILSQTARAHEGEDTQRPAQSSALRTERERDVRLESAHTAGILGTRSTQFGQRALPLQSSTTFGFEGETPISQRTLLDNNLSGVGQVRTSVERDWVTNVGVGNMSLGRTVGSDSGTFPRSVTGPTSLFVDTSGTATFPKPQLFGLGKDQGTQQSINMVLETMRSDTSTIHGSVNTREQVVELSYSITILPATQKGLVSLCRNLLGSGPLICIRRDCKLFGHHPSLKVDVAPGTVAVLQSSGIIFSSPVTHRSYVPLTLMRTWREARATIEEWQSIFTAANEGRFVQTNPLEVEKPFEINIPLETDEESVQEEDTIREDEVEVVESVEETESLTNKRKLAQLMSFASGIKVPTADRATRLEMDHEEGRPNEEMLKRTAYADPQFDIPSVLIRLENQQEDQGKAFELIADMLDVKDSWINQEITVLLKRATSLETVLGRGGRSQLTKETVWGSIALLSDLITEVQDKAKLLPREFIQLRSQLDDALRKLEERMQKVIGEFGHTVEQQLEGTRARLDAIERRSQEGEDNLLQVLVGSNKLKDELGELQQLVIEVATPSTTQVESTATLENMVLNLKSEFLEASTLLIGVEANVKKLMTGNDAEAVQFFNLGFNDVGSSDQWVSLHKPRYGYIVDVHLVFEHVFGQTSQEGVGTMEQLQQINKMKLTNLAQSLAIKSFEKRIPKYFMKPLDAATAHTGRTDSHFVGVHSYMEWDKPLKGYRDRLRDEIKVFSTTHMRTIDNAHANDTLNDTAYAISKESVLTSTTWILEFINYIDDTYKEMLRHNTFSTTKAWELVTQLGRRIFMELSVPRVGVQNTFDVEDAGAMAQQIFWPVVKCQDIMKRYQLHSFKDDPTIASEYVKFLAANSGSDVFEKMERRVGVLESFGSQALKEATAAKDKALSAFNKAEDVRKLNESLSKRVGLLEKHK